MGACAARASTSARTRRGSSSPSSTRPTSRTRDRPPADDRRRAGVHGDRRRDRSGRLAAGREDRRGRGGRRRPDRAAPGATGRGRSGPSRPRRSARRPTPASWPTRWPASPGSRWRSSAASRRPASRSPVRSSSLGSPRLGQVAVVDVGGGSTELVVGTHVAGPRWSRSLAVGSSSLTASCVRHDPPSRRCLAALERESAAAFAGLRPAAGRPRVSQSAGRQRHCCHSTATRSTRNRWPAAGRVHRRARPADGASASACTPTGLACCRPASRSCRGPSSCSTGRCASLAADCARGWSSTCSDDAPGRLEHTGVRWRPITSSFGQPAVTADRELGGEGRAGLDPAEPAAGGQGVDRRGHRLEADEVRSGRSEHVGDGVAGDELDAHTAIVVGDRELTGPPVCVGSSSSKESSNPRSPRRPESAPASTA